jgi:hypothetical protein
VAFSVSSVGETLEQEARDIMVLGHCLPGCPTRNVRGLTLPDRAGPRRIARSRYRELSHFQQQATDELNCQTGTERSLGYDDYYKRASKKVADVTRGDGPGLWNIIDRRLEHPARLRTSRRLEAAGTSAAASVPAVYSLGLWWAEDAVRGAAEDRSPHASDRNFERDFHPNQRRRRPGRLPTAARCF